MKIAVEGCCHGELNAIYKQIAHLEAKHKYKVDLLLICGDFQAIRNLRDLQCMAVPDKYKQLGEFYRYYTGLDKAPMLTIVIGGNHEASNYMWELYHGGWLAPNIYFLGHAGCVQVNGIRIAGASGIFNGRDFHQGHWERVPYDKSAMRSIYHIREFNASRLSLLSSPKIFLSHDWPQAIEQHGDVQDLLRRKPFFRQDIQSGNLGSPPLMGLLRTLRPQWWFSAHLHVRFEATVVHSHGIEPFSEPSRAGTGHGGALAVNPTGGANPDEIVIDEDDDPIPPKADMEAGQGGNPDEIVIEDISDATEVPSTDDSARGGSLLLDRNPDEIVLDEEVAEIAPPLKPIPRSETKFLALDKCLPRRQFLEVIDVPVDPSYASLSTSTDSSVRFTFDPEWLAITRALHPYLSTTRYQRRLPDVKQAKEMVQRELQWVLQNVGGKERPGGLQEISDCQVFRPTAPGPGHEGKAKSQQPPWYTNPQTVAFCEMLELENKINPVPLGMDIPRLDAHSAAEFPGEVFIDNGHGESGADASFREVGNRP